MNNAHISDTAIDYLVIGHVTCDLTPQGCTPGGTAVYAGRTAQVLGCRTAVLTSTGPETNLAQALPHIRTHTVPAPRSTTFENIYPDTDQPRIQHIHAVAQTLTCADVPAAWQRASIVHLGPIAAEIEPDVINLFANSLIGLTPQGWMRRWDENGRVYARRWPAAPDVLPLAAAVILSEEDLLDGQMLDQYRQWSRLVVLTQGWRGCTVFLGDETREVPAPAVAARAFTGAVDIFATAFLIRLQQTGGNPWEAARFANLIASQSVTQPDPDRKMAHLTTYWHDLKTGT